MTTLDNPGYPDWIVDAPRADTRNVIDHYKCWTDAAIREDLAASASNLLLVAENFAHDFNIATLVRNANAFNAAGVVIVGHRQWDRRGAVGTHHYTSVAYERDAADFYARLVADGYTIVAVDNVSGAQDLPGYRWPSEPTAVIFGQESIGVSNLALRHADTAVMVPQSGSVRSLNVGTTSGVVLYDHQVKTALRGF